MAYFTFLPIPNDRLPDVEYGDEEFVEIHLDERFYVGENMTIHKVWDRGDDQLIVQKDYKLFYDPDQCLNFITSYEWRKIFLSLTDHFSYMLPLIHDLPQIIYIYIYSQAPERVSYSSAEYPKLRAILKENSTDADHQLLEDIQKFRQDLMPMNIINPVQRKTKLLIQEPLQIETCSVVWIKDSNNSEIFDIASVPHGIDCLKIFFQIPECVNYIQSSSNDHRVFVVSSFSDTETVLKEISSLSKVIAIYLLNIGQHPTMNLNNSITKVRGTYSDKESLFNQLSQEYRRYKNEAQMSVSVFSRENHEKTIRDLNKESSRFIWLQLLVDILIQIPYNDQTKDEMVHECRIHYKDDKSALESIEDFQKNYKTSQALLFYTNDSFLYRLFNRALRTENIDFLFIFRFFLADMYKQLKQLHTEQFSVNPKYTGPTLNLYRGQPMRVSELHQIKNNIGGLLSVNTFFSTTEDFELAKLYSGHDNKDRLPDSTSILFEIEIDLTHPVTTKPFASIAHLSRFSDEREVLFSVGSIFRLQNAEYIEIEQGFWYVQMKLIDQDDDLQEFRNELESEYCHKSNLINLGNALFAMGDYERAERYFRMLLEYLPESHSFACDIHTSLGLTLSKKGNYQAALEFYEKALKLGTVVKIYDQSVRINQIYAHMGAAYHQIGQKDTALKYLFMAQDMTSSPEPLSFIYNQIAMAYREKGEYLAALEYFQKTLHIEENILKRTKYYPVLATMYNNIGEIYMKLDDYEKASKYLHHALEIRLKGTVSTHTDLAAIYNNLGLLYQRNKELKKALEMFEKALDIDTQTFKGDHEALSVSHNNIGSIYATVGNLPKALYHAETSLRTLLRSQAKNNPSMLSKSQFNIATIQYLLRNNEKALKMAEKALKSQQEYLPEKHENLARTYQLLSNIYTQQNNFRKASEYFQKSIEIARITILPKDEASFNAFESQFELLKTDYSKSMGYCVNAVSNVSALSDDLDSQNNLTRQALERLQLIETDDIVNRIGSLCTLIAVNSKQKNFQAAFKYFDEANSLYTQYQSSDMLLQQEVEQLMINVFYSASRVYYRQNNWIMSLEMLEKSLDLALKQKQEHSLLPEIYHCMGLSYTHQLDIPMAIYYLELAVSTARKTLPSNNSRLEIYLGHLRGLKPSAI